ncbi:hypothetical protein MG293_010039 [Ovis ammon polii]|uniref:Uncharacterized protein n=1 Tax=Ovis ammon polii TaxID=230172 RepID=A0AAD4U8F8_OVIAM|nr:hypothetical protein MG293_010039 [Ovis ammon polii]
MALRKAPPALINQCLEGFSHLQAYEVEYHGLQEELTDCSLSDNQRMHKLEKTNSSLHKQNCDLLEQLQAANGRIQSLGATPEKLLTSESKLKQAALALELEWSALLQTVEQLWRQTPHYPSPWVTDGLGPNSHQPTAPEQGFVVDAINRFANSCQ